MKYTDLVWFGDDTPGNKTTTYASAVGFFGIVSFGTCCILYMVSTNPWVVAAFVGYWVAALGAIPAGIILLMNRLSRTVPLNCLKSCARIARLCKGMPEVDSGMVGQITSLATQIDKYGKILLSRATTISKMADACSDEETRNKLRKMAEERVAAVHKITGKFQSLMPSIINGSYANEIEDITADLEQVKGIIDRTNKEITSTKPNTTIAKMHYANEGWYSIERPPPTKRWM